MMGLALTVPVEHFDDNDWSNSVEYRTRYPAEVVKARMVDGLKLIRYAKEATFKTEERRCLCHCGGLFFCFSRILKECNVTQKLDSTTPQKLAQSNLHRKAVSKRFFKS